MLFRSSLLFLLATAASVQGDDMYYSSSSNNYNGQSSMNSYESTSSYSSNYLNDDDFFSAMGDQASQLAMMAFGKCLIGLNMNQMSNDPFVDVKKRCNEAESQTFNEALSTFQSCAGFDLKSLIENFGSMYLGLVLNCGSYAMEFSDLMDRINMGMIDQEKLMEQESPFPRVPGECVEALVGDNPFGRAFLYADEFPEREMQCFKELHTAVPRCTLSEWPIPIVGTWLKAASCVYGSMDEFVGPFMEQALNDQFQAYDQCLPETIDEPRCKPVRNDCLFNYGAATMALPPPFWAPPMNNQVRETAERTGYAHVVEKYDMYREICIPPEDRNVWEIAIKNNMDSTSGSGGANAFVVDSEGGIQLGEPQRTSSSSKFMPGMFFGLFMAFAGMFGYHKYKEGELPMPSGYDFHSLEMSDNQYA